MNWNAIGAVGELLGAIGVILSLVYLGGQIRQNTRTQRRSNLGDVAGDLSAVLRSVSTDPELSSLVLRGLADLGALNPNERYQFDAFLYSWLVGFERALLDARDGDYPEENLAPMRRAIAGFLRTEGARVWWEERKVWFSSYGQQCMDRIIDDRDIDDLHAGPQLPSQTGPGS